MNEWYNNNPNPITPPAAPEPETPAPAQAASPAPETPAAPAHSYYVPQGAPPIHGYTPPRNETAPPAEPEKKKKSGGKGGKIIALALVCAILGGLLGTGGTLLTLRVLGRGDRQEGATVLLQGQRAQVELAEVDTGELLSASQVYAQNVNSTVGITTAITTNFWGYQTTSAAAGSGFILSDDGYILTNYHVIEDSSSITVTLYDGTSYDAELVGYDESNDVAVLKVDAEGLSPVVLGDSDALLVGDSVVAIGNPLGELTFSLTIGVVSALDRDITLSSGTSMNLIQTDCAINSGNSGGALFNLYGEVIGITNAKYSSSSLGEANIDNIGFAIPINHVRDIVESIIEYGYIAKPYIGVSVTDVSTESQNLGLPQGAAVAAVNDDSPARKAGLQVNDIITDANGSPITGSSDLVAIVRAMSPGDKLKLSVYRQGETLSITVTVEESVQDALPASPQESAAQSQTMPSGGQSGQSGQKPQEYYSVPFSFEDFFGSFY